MKQPHYSTLEPKLKAREENVLAYRRITGLPCLPPDRGYWTLCNDQTSITSEIRQMLDLGVIKYPRQFYGVDWDQNIINSNRSYHPEANWFADDWLNVITTQNFNAGLIYLDTTSLANYKRARDLVVTTMYACKAQTVLFANLMLNRPYSKERFSVTDIINVITKSVVPQELEKWQSKLEVYTYNCSRTEMVTYILHKERN